MTKNTSNPENVFACRKCGIGIKAPPPDSSFKYAYISACKEESNEENHNYKQFYACSNCDEGVTLYWCQGHVHIAVSSRSTEYQDDFRRSRMRYNRFGDPEFV